MVLENETKYEKFVRLGDVRLRRIQEDLRKLGNLSNRRNYDFDEVAVGYLMHHISKEFIVLKQKFNVKRKTKLLKNINQSEELETINKSNFRGLYK